MRLPLFVFPSGQSYGLVWDMKRGFLFSFRLPSGRAARNGDKPDSQTVKRNEGMKWLKDGNNED